MKQSRGFIGLSALFAIIGVFVLAVVGTAWYLEGKRISISRLDQMPQQTSQTQQASTTKAQENGVSVAGMSQYTDQTFGFSFWYPSGWVVKEIPVQSPTQNGWFQDGIIVRQLSVTNPNPSVSSATGVTIQEFRSSGVSITELGATKSASPVGVDQKYFFDTKTHTWMFENLTDTPDGSRPSGTITPADISSNTMGGLHIFLGAKRFGADSIVPLSARNFLIISTNDPGGYTDQAYLVNTIVAIDPSVATPMGVAQQASAVQSEKDAYAQSVQTDRSASAQDQYIRMNAMPLGNGLWQFDFSGQLSVQQSTYSLSFGDGASVDLKCQSTAANGDPVCTQFESVAHAYAQPGTYQVALSEAFVGLGPGNVTLSQVLGLTVQTH